jgi:PAS domain S-box-containing protein
MTGPIEFRPIDRSQHELLVVDDNPASRYATARLLRSAGFRTCEAASGEEGLKAVNDTLSAMVLDVHLPDIDGFELCRRLRSQPGTRRLPVLHLTAAYVTDEDKVRGLDAGADAYLTRPVEPAVLVATVQALVRAHAAEEAMRRSEARFRTIYSQAPGGICLFDAAGRFVDANPAMLQLMQREADQVIGHTVSEFVPPDAAAGANRLIGSSDGTAQTVEFALLDASGNEVHLEWRLSSHLEPGIRLALVTDISLRVLLERQRQQLLESERIARSVAERTNRLKDDLIAVLSHELRTPLNAILSWTHVLQRTAESDKTLHGLQAIERNGKMQARMISDILDMSRLNLGKIQLKLESLDPGGVLSDAVNAMRPTMEEKGIEVSLALAPFYSPVRADAARLQQVVWNLLSNAVKFSPRGGLIVVRLQDEERGVRLTVTDQGRGIEADDLPLIFDRFVQSSVHGAYGGGLGLGLSIVKQLVEAHGGSVGVRSEGAGRGAEFEVWLPREGPQRVADDAAPAEPSDWSPLAEDGELTLHGLKLLVVDDDAEAAEMLRIILGDRGADVRVAHDGEEALASVAGTPPDVIISDVGMPGRNGYELLRELRELEGPLSRRLPAIALTSFSRPQDREQALQAGFDLHIAKPLRPLLLVHAIARLAGRHGAKGAD